MPMFGRFLRTAILKLSQVINLFENLQELTVPLFKKLYTWEKLSTFRKGFPAS